MGVLWLAVGIVKRFLANRGTQLSAMIAYYALLSFVPLTFLALAAFGLVGRQDADSALVERLHEILPGAPVDKIVDSLGSVQDAARTFGLIGAVLLVWSSLGLFNALQTAFNLVYRRPRRSFAAGRGTGAAALLLLIVAGVVLFLTTTVVSGIVGELLPALSSRAGVGFLATFATGVTGTFVVLAVVYYTLTNAPMSWREVLPGAVLGALAIQVTFQVVPLFLRLTSGSLAVQMLGSTALLLIWFYVLALIVVFCAEINWGMRHRASPADRESAERIPDRDNP
jgi:YihY family inner membrane protein